jgi:PKD repeat protein
MMEKKGVMFMNNFFKRLFCLSVASVLSVQAEEYKLCILVDGSQKMVTEKTYDAVLSALDAKILDAQKQKVIKDDWSVEIVAVGVTKQLLSSRRFSGTLALYPSPPGAGLDSKKKNNRIPNVTDESPLNYAELLSPFRKFVSDKATLNSGVILISDQPNVNMFSSEGKYHKNILVELANNNGGLVMAPNRMKLVTDIKAAFDGFFAYINEQKKTPTVSVECLEKDTIYVGAPVKFRIKGADLSYVTVNYGTPSSGLKIEQAEIDRVMEYTYASKGRFAVVVQGVLGNKAVNATVSVNVQEKALLPELKISAAGARHYAGFPVRFNVVMANASEAVIDFGDKAMPLKKIQELSAQSLEHVYFKSGDFRVVVTAKGAGGEVKKEVPIRVEMLTAIDLDLESSTPPDGKVIATPAAELADEVRIDFGDKTVLSAAHGQPVTHSYTKDGEYLIKMTVSRLGKEETVEKKFSVKIPVAKKELSPLELRVEISGASVLVTPKAEQASLVEVDFGSRDAAVMTKDMQPVRHTYKSDGEYTVTMKATREGKIEEKSEVVKIKLEKAIPAPKAVFVLETSSAGELAPESDGRYNVKRGETIDFVNKSKNAQRFKWVLGVEKDPLTERSVTYEYEKDGVYEVVLTAYGENNQSDVCRVSVNVHGGRSSIVWFLLLLPLCAGIGWAVLSARRPELSVVLSIKGQDGNAKTFSLFGHRVALSELSIPLDCRAKKVDGIWMVEFRALEESMLEKRPSLSPIRLEAKTWTQPINSGEFVVAGNPDEVIKIQEV